MIWRIKGFYKDNTSIKYLADEMEEAQKAVEKLIDIPEVYLVTIEVADKSCWRNVFNFEV